MASQDPPRRAPGDLDAATVAKALHLEAFFPEFTGELCAKVFPRSGVCQYEPGHRLIEQGENGRDLFVLLGGEVSVTLSFGSLGAEVAKLDTGHLLGEIGLLFDGTRTATAIAVSDVRAYRLAYEDVGYLLENNPDLAAHLKGLAEARRS